MATVLQGAAMKPAAAAAAGAAVGQRAAAPNLGGGIGLASPGFRRLAFGCGLRRGEQRVRSHSVQAALEPSDKSIEVMRKFSEQYARRSDTFFCVDKGVTSVVIKGLAEHKDSLGAPLCPCRHYDDKVAEVQQGFWNCPCVPMRERKECHCMLFLTADNDFAGQDQAISMEEIKELTANV